jgi:hypothetical protein
VDHQRSAVRVQQGHAIRSASAAAQGRKAGEQLHGRPAVLHPQVRQVAGFGSLRVLQPVLRLACVLDVRPGGGEARSRAVADRVQVHAVPAVRQPTHLQPHHHAVGARREDRPAQRPAADVHDVRAGLSAGQLGQGRRAQAGSPVGQDVAQGSATGSGKGGEQRQHRDDWAHRTVS